jgi:hypothetical protein
MIKKTIAIASIMLASIVLLAHSVVPHHHHNKQVCLVSTHCTNDKSTDEHGSTKENHSHDGENNAHDCVLKESAVILSDHWKSYLKFENNRYERSGLDDYHHNLLNSSTEFVIPFLFSYIHERHPDCSYSSLITASLGLRAPPVI